MIQLLSCDLHDFFYMIHCAHDSFISPDSFHMIHYFLHVIHRLCLLSSLVQVQGIPYNHIHLWNRCLFFSNGDPCSVKWGLSKELTGTHLDETWQIAEFDIRLPIREWEAADSASHAKVWFLSHWVCIITEHLHRDEQKQTHFKQRKWWKLY